MCEERSIVLKSKSGKKKDVKGSNLEVYNYKVPLWQLDDHLSTEKYIESNRGIKLIAPLSL